MRYETWRQKVENLRTWSSACTFIFWCQSELEATGLVLYIFYPVTSKHIITNELILASMCKMYVGYSVLILVLHAWKQINLASSVCRSSVRNRNQRSPFCSCLADPRVWESSFMHTELCLFPKENKTFCCLGQLQEAWAVLEVETVKMLWNKGLTREGR